MPPNEVHLPQIVEPSPLVLIQQALEAKIPASELKGFFDLQVRAEERRAEGEYAEAITAFQAECPPIKKNATNKGSGTKYADYEQIMRTITPLLRKHRIVITWDTTESDGKMLVTCRVRVGVVEKHTSIAMPCEPATTRMNDAQGIGAATKYGRRYAIVAALNLFDTDEDDDAQSLSNPLATEDEIAALYELMKQFKEVARGQEFTMGHLMGWKKLAAIRDIRQSHFREFQTFLERKIAEAKKGAK